MEQERLSWVMPPSLPRPGLAIHSSGWRYAAVQLEGLAMSPGPSLQPWLPQQPPPRGYMNIEGTSLSQGETEPEPPVDKRPLRALCGRHEGYNGEIGARGAAGKRGDRPLPFHFPPSTANCPEGDTVAQPWPAWKQADPLYQLCGVDELARSSLAPGHWVSSA